MMDRSTALTFSPMTVAIRRISQAAFVLILIGGLAACDVFSSDPDPPAVVEAIDDQAIEADETLEFDLETVFDDPEGEGLTYEAESSDEAVAEVSISEATLAVEPNSGGEALITVEAENEGGRTETSFEVAIDLPDPPDERPD